MVQAARTLVVGRSVVLRRLHADDLLQVQRWLDLRLGLSRRLNVPRKVEITAFHRQSVTFYFLLIKLAS